MRLPEPSGRGGELTDSPRGAQAKENHVPTVGVVKELDELMQHDGDGRDTHAMLKRASKQKNKTMLFACHRYSPKRKACESGRLIMAELGQFKTMSLLGYKCGDAILTLMESTGPTLYMQ